MTGERRFDDAVESLGISERDLGRWPAGSRVLHRQPSGTSVDPVAVDIVLPITLFQEGHDSASRIPVFKFLHLVAKNDAATSHRGQCLSIGTTTSVVVKNSIAPKGHRPCV